MSCKLAEDLIMFVENPQFDLYTIFTFLLINLTEVLNLYRNQLTEYERQEIDKFPEIWYLGLDSCKINAKPGTALNAGYDDDNGSYNKVISNERIRE